MRRVAKKKRAFPKRLANEPNVAVLEITKPTVDQFGRPARCASRDVAAFEHHHPKTSQRGISRYGRAMNSRPNDGQIEPLSR